MHSTSLLQSLQDLSIMLRILNSMVFKSVQYLALGLFFNFLILLSPPLSTWPSFCSSRKPLAISFTWYQFSSVQSLSRVGLFATPTLCDPMNRSTPGLSVHHQLLEFTQTHVHRVGDAIQPSHPLSSTFPPAPNPSQHQSLFQ